jgi:hypothetical protein
LYESLYDRSRGDKGAAEELAIKEANTFPVDTSYVSTPEPKSEPAALILKDDIVVWDFMHSCAPCLNLAR